MPSERTFFSCEDEMYFAALEEGYRKDHLGESDPDCTKKYTGANARGENPYDLYREFLKEYGITDPEYTNIEDGLEWYGKKNKAFRDRFNNSEDYKNYGYDERPQWPEEEVEL